MCFYVRCAGAGAKSSKFVLYEKFADKALAQTVAYVSFKSDEVMIVSVLTC